MLSSRYESEGVVLEYGSSHLQCLASWLLVTIIAAPCCYSVMVCCYRVILCSSQALQNRSLNGAFALFLGVQLLAYVLIYLPRILETRGKELAPAIVYSALCVTPALAGLRSRGGEHAAQRSLTLVFSNLALALLMVLWGLDFVVFPTSFMQVW